MSVTAKVSQEEREFVAEHLNLKEQKLFERLQLSEQKHSINVALDIKDNVDSQHMDDLIKLALLHDIGKIQSKLTPIDKGIIVILDQLTKGKLKNYTKYKKIDGYYHHGQAGYKLLKETGDYDQLFLQRVRDHHSKPAKGDEYLKILQKWDNKN